MELRRQFALGQRIGDEVVGVRVQADLTRLNVVPKFAISDSRNCSRLMLSGSVWSAISIARAVEPVRPK